MVVVGLVASVVLLILFALIGAFDVFAFGALAGLWSLGVAWHLIFGPPVIDRRILRARCRDAWAALRLESTR